MPRNLFSQADIAGMQPQQQSQAMPAQDQGLIPTIANSAPVNAILGAGDALRNMLSLGYLSNSDSSNFGTTAGPNSGSGTAYNIGKVAGDIGGFIGGGEVLDAIRGAMALRGLPGISQVAESLGGNGISGIARRAIGGSIAGAAENPDDRLGGAEEGGLMSLAGEAIPVVGKGLRKVAEYITPNEFTKGIVDTIKSTYQDARDQVSKYMDPVTQKFGNYKIFVSSPNRNFFNIPQAIIDELPANFRAEYDSIIKNPNKFSFNDAHNLSKRLGEEYGRTLSGFADTAAKDRALALTTVRSSLNDDLLDFLRQRNANAANQWNYGKKLFEQNVLPYRSNTTLRKIAEDNIQTISPNKLQNVISTADEAGAIPQNHYLSEALENLTSKINKGKLAGSALSMLGGLSVGGSLGGIGGGIGGLAAGKYLGPQLIELSTNPEFIKLMQRLAPTYRLGVNATIGGNLEGT